MIASLLQHILNRYLLLDPESKRRLQKLQQKSITIELKGTGIVFQMFFNEGKLELKTQDFHTPDVIIRSAPLSLLHVAISRENRKNLFTSDVLMEGDLDLGQDVIALFDELEIDWFEYLSRWIGDVSAHHAESITKNIKNFSSRLRQSITRNMSEYVQEEAHFSPPREALQDFFQDVDELRMDVDRLEVRVEKLIKETQ